MSKNKSYKIKPIITQCFTMVFINAFLLLTFTNSLKIFTEDQLNLIDSYLKNYLVRSGGINIFTEISTGKITDQTHVSKYIQNIYSKVAPNSTYKTYKKKDSLSYVEGETGQNHTLTLSDEQYDRISDSMQFFRIKYDESFLISPHEDAQIDQRILPTDYNLPNAYSNDLMASTYISTAIEFGNLNITNSEMEILSNCNKFIAGQLFNFCLDKNGKLKIYKKSYETNYTDATPVDFANSQYDAQYQDMFVSFGQSNFNNKENPLLFLIKKSKNVYSILVFYFEEIRKVPSHIFLEYVTQFQITESGTITQIGYDADNIYVAIKNKIYKYNHLYKTSNYNFDAGNYAINDMIVLPRSIWVLLQNYGMKIIDKTDTSAGLAYNDFDFQHPYLLKFDQFFNKISDKNTTLFIGIVVEQDINVTKTNDESTNTTNNTDINNNTNNNTINNTNNSNKHKVKNNRLLANKKKSKNESTNKTTSTLNNGVPEILIEFIANGQYEFSPILNKVYYDSKYKYSNISRSFVSSNEYYMSFFLNQQSNQFYVIPRTLLFFQKGLIFKYNLSSYEQTSDTSNYPSLFLSANVEYLTNPIVDNYYPFLIFKGSNYIFLRHKKEDASKFVFSFKYKSNYRIYFFKHSDCSNYNSSEEYQYNLKECTKAYVFQYEIAAENSNENLWDFVIIIVIFIFIFVCFLMVYFNASKDSFNKIKIFVLRRKKNDELTNLKTPSKLIKIENNKENITEISADK